MKYKLYILLIIILVGCKSDPVFINNKDLKHEISERLKIQKTIAANRSESLFNIFDSGISSEEKELLEFLYAYMPLSDMADYNGEFFLQQVKYSLLAKETFNWGKQIPEDIFLHFVLPYRVNNENPDTARKVFFEELKFRIKDLSMKEAALEVNHWCHEKVSYHPSDIRTSAPLSTVKNALGRCGEESTLTVTAMRAVGIPARQIYTPRWAHSDDNHAWVEVWVDGEWYFLGACEPEPDLNMGWFAAPATRAMLLHSKVFGNYFTSDDIVTQDDRYTEINVLPDYAPAKRVYVKVYNSEKEPVTGALVQFKLYNYAEFYSIARVFTDEKGTCSLLTGFGDLIVWASKDGLIDYKKLRVSISDTLKLFLQSNLNNGIEENYEFIPPPIGEIVEVSEAEQERNNKRLRYEDSLRYAYEKTFIDSLDAVELANKLNVDPRKTWQILHTSRGNWEQIVKFLQESPSSLKHRALDLLSVISEKDLHDTPGKVLSDHLLNTDSSYCKDKYLFTNYVLNPHISNEILSEYKKYIREYFSKSFIDSVRHDIDILVRWIGDNVTLSDANTSRTPLKPRGVLEIKYADKHSRNLFFVAACRSFGIPARLESSRSVPQVMMNKNWTDISFESIVTIHKPKARLKLLYTGGLASGKPEYYIHFTLGKFDGTSYQTLDYENSNEFDKFPAEIAVDTGQYVLITGNRLQTGTVLAKVKYFTLSENSHVTQLLEFNQGTDNELIYGSIDLSKNVSLLNSNHTKNTQSLNELTNNQSLVLIWIEPDKEPTKHLINDIYKLKSNFDSWQGNLIFLIPPEKWSNEFDLQVYRNLPNNSSFVVDSTNLLSSIETGLQTKLAVRFPVVLIVDKKGNIIYTSSGYKIGSGEQILNKIIPKCIIP